MSATAWRRWAGGVLLAMFLFSQHSVLAQPKEVPAGMKPTAEHLLWAGVSGGRPLEKMTLIYGEVEVLASAPTTYFCPIQWQAGFGGAGYCGLQQQANGRRNVIFSVWHSAPDLPAKTVRVGVGVSANNFGHEGLGQWTTVDYPWQVGQVFRFVLMKAQDSKDQNTLTSFYFYDEATKKWKFHATLASPTNSDRVRYFGGGVLSFLENFSGDQPERPRLCLIRLWGGTTAENLIYLRNATGDGHWGILSGCCYFAHGNDKELDALLASRFMDKDRLRLNPKGTWANTITIEDRPLSPPVIESVRSLTIAHTRGAP